jgi:hypothetical protein
VVGSTSGHKDDTENDEAYNSNDLQAREPEFHLSENPSAEEVDCEDEDQKYGHVYSRMSDGVCSSATSGVKIGGRTPITNDDGGGHNLYRNGDRPTVCVRQHWTDMGWADSHQ